MRWSFIRAVAAKELLSTLRDRRTLLSTVLVPLLLIPVFTVGFPLLLGRAFGGQNTVRQTVGVQGALPKTLSERLSAAGDGVRLIPVPDALAAVRAGTVDAALRVTAPIPALVTAPVAAPGSGPAGAVSGRVELVGRFGNLKARSGVLSKLDDTLSAYNRALVDASLRSRGLGQSFLSPLLVAQVDATPKAEARSGQLAFLIPMFLMQFILAGGLATALDSTAGEKERGTLEVLLVSPVRRSEVVVGKLLATAASALGAALFSFLGLLLSAPLSLLFSRGAGPSAGGARAAALSSGLGGGLALTLSGALLIALLAVSAALLLSSLLVAVGIFARSLREAQTYTAPVSLLIVLPAVGLQFADFLTRGPLLYSAPLIGGMLAILDVVRGTPHPALALLSVLSNLALTALLALLALRSFGREGVIFR